MKGNVVKHGEVRKPSDTESIDDSPSDEWKPDPAVTKGVPQKRLIRKSVPMDVESPIAKKKKKIT